MTDKLNEHLKRIEERDSAKRAQEQEAARLQKEARLQEAARLKKIADDTQLAEEQAREAASRAHAQKVQTLRSQKTLILDKTFKDIYDPLSALVTSYHQARFPEGIEGQENVFPSIASAQGFHSRTMVISVNPSKRITITLSDDDIRDHKTEASPHALTINRTDDYLEWAENWEQMFGIETHHYTKKEYVFEGQYRDVQKTAYIPYFNLIAFYRNFLDFHWSQQDGFELWNMGFNHQTLRTNHQTIKDVPALVENLETLLAKEIQVQMNPQYQAQQEKHRHNTQTAKYAVRGGKIVAIAGLALLFLKACTPALGEEPKDGYKAGNPQNYERVLGRE